MLNKSSAESDLKGIQGSRVQILPSIICINKDNLKSQLSELISIGIEALHVDLIDGKFSPSMPLTFEELDKICDILNLPLDFHIMANNSEPFVKRALDFNAQQICFHWETTLHADRLLNIIKKQGVRCGIALTPATPIWVLEYVVEICDFILLMLVNPGYAFDGNEKQVSYAQRKILDCRRFLDKHNHEISVEVDGRVSIESIPSLVAAGANILVAGTTSLFLQGSTIKENYDLIKQAVKGGLKKRLL